MSTTHSREGLPLFIVYLMKQFGALWVGVDEGVIRGALEQTDKQGVGVFRKR
jgi:hypothetical protein